MKKVFRFNYNSIQDYVEKTNIIFFHIPFLQRRELRIPLYLLKFDRNIFLLQSILTAVRYANTANEITKYGKFEFDIDDFKFTYELVLNSDLLENLGLKIEKLQNFEVGL